MFNPLALKINSDIEISLNNQKNKINFKCKEIENFYNLEYLNTVRYLLKESDDFIEIQKDSLKNFHLNYYTLIEKVSFDLTFFSLLGASTLSYKHPKYQNSYITYQKKIYPNEKYETIKVLIDFDDYLLNQIDGYFQDANENWYYLVQKYAGSIKKSTNHVSKIFWEYISDKDTILIEISSSNKMQHLQTVKPKIYVYKKINLKRKDIKIDLTTTDINYI